MPIPLLAEGVGRGWSSIPYLGTALQAAAIIGVVTLLKLYFGGAKCRAERVMHGKVVMVTVGLCFYLPLQLLIDQNIRAVQQVSVLQSCKNWPLEAPRSSSSHTTLPLTRSWLTTLKICGL